MPDLIGSSYDLSSIVFFATFLTPDVPHTIPFKPALSVAVPLRLAPYLHSLFTP